MARRDVRDDTALVHAVRSGDSDAFGILFERWFDRVYDVARNIVRSPETAADVAQDTFVSAWERIGSLDRPEAFGGWLLRIARNRALDRLEREGRSTSQDADVVTGLHDRGTPDLVGSRRELDVEEINATRDRDALVHAAAVALGERDASLLDLQLRHGLTPSEIAEELGVTPNNAHQLLFRMRAKLGDAVGAVVLWRRGNPACPDLASLLAGAGDTFDRSTFDRSTFDLVERHRERCDLCADRRAALLAPEQLFSAAPILIAPALLKAGIVERLGRLGIDVGESGVGAGGPSPSDGFGSANPSGAPDPTTTWAPPPDGPPSEMAADPPDAGDRQHDGGVPPGTAAGGTSPMGPWADPTGPLEPTAVASIVAGDDPAVNDLANDDPADDARRRRRRALLLVAASILVVTGIAGSAVVANRSSGDRDAELASPPATTSPDDGPTTTRGGALTATTGAPQQRSGTTAPAMATATTVATTEPAETTTPVATTIAAPPLPPAPTAPPTTRRPATTAPPQTVAPTVPPVAEPPPPAPETTAPPPPPPTTAPPPPTTAAPVPTTTTPPAPPPPAPDVVRFYFGTVPAGLLCADPADIPRRFMWTSTGATSAQLLVAGIARSVAVNGGYNTCAASGDVATISVSGLGGADSASLTVP